MLLVPSDLFNLKTIDLSNIKDEDCMNDDTLKVYFWPPNPLINDALLKYINKHRLVGHIIDVGSGLGHNIFPKATHILGLDNKASLNGISQISIDLDFDKFIFSNNYFDFLYCRHTLEDLQNPQNAFAEIVRVAKHGYIETPSPLIEITRGADKGNYRGYIHHRYFVWSDLKTNTLYFLPKYPIVDQMSIIDNIVRKHNHILNNFPVYWNNYYMWDETSSPNIVVYRNEVNFDITKDYINILNSAILASIEYTNHFISYLKTL
jgi:hypothetical protein